MEQAEKQAYGRFATYCRLTCKPYKGCKYRKQHNMKWDKLETLCPKKPDIHMVIK